MQSKRSFVALEARRIAQTPAAFSNWPELLSGVARSRLGGGPDTLTFHTRTGQSISIPNAGGARVPVYEVFAEDCYDLAWFLGDLADRPIHVLDIGAHVGTFSCSLGRLHPQATVDAYEPTYDTAQFLRRNVAANGLEGRIHVHEAALAGETGFAMFERTGNASGFNRLAAVDGRDEGIRVETVSFDDVVARSDQPIELVKMDCEGGEYDLVYRSDPANWQSVQRLVLEYHPVQGESWEELRAWFAGVGLHVVRSSPGTPGLGVAWLSREPLDDPIGRPEGGALQQAGHDVRRVVQTPGTFSNWPGLLTGMVRERAGKGPETLTFRTRSGLRLTTPNVPGARLPAYEQFAEDSYRLEWFLGDLLDRPIHVVDAGAHVGTFACRLAEVHPTATITCLEPSAETARFLQHNIEVNCFDRRITVEEAALTGETGWAEFDDQGDASVHSGLVRDGGAAVGEVTKVRSLAWDDIAASAPAPIEFVKLDCEGGEYELTSSSPDSWDSVQRVVLEYHDVPGASWAELRAWFASLGLHVVYQEPTRRNLGLAWLSRSTVDFPGR
jgi:FkbM family methyltransferase